MLQSIVLICMADNMLTPLHDTCIIQLTCAGLILEDILADVSVLAITYKSFTFPVLTEMETIIMETIIKESFVLNYVINLHAYF